MPDDRDGGELYVCLFVYLCSPLLSRLGSVWRPFRSTGQRVAQSVATIGLIIDEGNRCCASRGARAFEQEAGGEKEFKFSSLHLDSASTVTLS